MNNINRNYLLGSYLKNQVYKNSPLLFLGLRDTIICIIAEIESHLCQNVIEKVKKVVDICEVRRGGELLEKELSIMFFFNLSIKKAQFEG